MNTKKTNKTEAATVQIGGSIATIRRLTNTYQLREVLLPHQLEVFDRFVALRGNKFRKTEARMLELLADDTAKGNRHRILEAVIEYFSRVGWPKGSKAVWAKWRQFFYRRVTPREGRLQAALERKRAMAGGGKYAGFDPYTLDAPELERPRIPVFNDGHKFKRFS